MIKYALAKNQMAKDKPNYVANVSCMDYKNYDDLIDIMVEEGSGLTRPQALAYFERLIQSVNRLLENGCTINTPLFKVRPTIKGVFETADDYFDPKKQKLSYTMCAGKRMKPVTANIELKKIKSSLPVIKTYFDGVSRETNTIITPGGNAVIKGENLQFDPEDPEQGVFFCEVHHPKTAIRALSFMKNTFNEITFMVPRLEAGNYILKIKTCNSDKSIKSNGTLKQVLTVV
jgi:hypothetical protein